MGIGLARFGTKIEVLTVAGDPVPDLETVVIGGGAVGLAVARSLALAGQEVTLLEQHERLGTETSSRNSEVIHAGLYYPPGSLQARLCVAGKLLLYPFLSEHGVPHERLGKLLVATDASQLPELANYKSRAALNGVDDLQPLTGTEAKALEPEVRCVAALLSPSTGILDSHAYMQAVAGEAEARGAQIVLNSKVVAIVHSGGLFRFQLQDGQSESVSCRRLVLAAGLHSSKLARQLTFASSYRPPETYYARGRYYSLKTSTPFSRLVYPMPVPGGSGTHITLDLSGRAKFGPDVQWIDAIDYSFDRSAEAQFYSAIRRYWPGLPDGALEPNGTGIRPKLTQQGQPGADFAIHGPEQHGLAGLVMLFGIESPGLTSSLAIGNEVAGLLAAGTWT